MKARSLILKRLADWNTRHNLGISDVMLDDAADILEQSLAPFFVPEESPSVLDVIAKTPEHIHHKESDK